MQHHDNDLPPKGSGWRASGARAEGFARPTSGRGRSFPPRGGIPVRGAALALGLTAILALLPYPGPLSGQGSTLQSAPGPEEVARALAAYARAPEGARPPVPLAGREYLRTEDHPDENVFEIVVGPVDLPAGMEHLRLPIQLATFPDREAHFHGFSWEIRDARGEKLPDELLHHVNFVDPDHRELFSPVARRLFAAGRETKSAGLPSFLGIPLEPGHRFLVSAMFANQTDRDFEGAFLHVKLRYARAEEKLLGPVSVLPFYLDVMGPVGPKGFDLPPGRTEVGWTGSPAIDARILGLSGHLHDYAVEIRLEDVTTGEVVWRAEPVATEDGLVRAVPVDKPWWRGGLKLEAEHEYRTVVVYHNPTDGPAPDGGMGVVAGVVLPSGDADWPPFDRRDPDYLKDLENTLTEPYRNRGHGHASHASR